MSDTAISDRAAENEDLARLNSLGFWLLVVVLAFSGMLFALTKVACHDVAYFIDAAGHLLDGAQLYSQVVDFNPPIIFLISMLPVALSRWLEVDPLWLWHLLVGILALLSTLLTIRIAARFLPQDLPERWLAPPLLFAFLIVPHWEFGQREHLLAILLVPYVIAAAGRRHRLPLGLSLCVGLGAGLGIAIKPYFAAYLIVIEMLLLVRDRSLRSLGRPAFVAAVAVGAGAVVTTLVVFPRYLEMIVPTARALYGGYGKSFERMLATPQFQISLGLLLVLLPFLRGKPGPGRTLALLLGATGGVGLLVYLIQGKGWRYHALPSLVFLTIGLAVALMVAFAGWQQPLRQRRLLSCLAGLVLLALAQGALSSARTLDARVRSGLEPLIALVAQAAPGQPLLCLSTYIESTFPLVSYSGAIWPHRYSNLLLFPGLYSGWDAAATGRPFRSMAEMSPIEVEFIDAIVSDAVRARPRLILVDLRPQLPSRVPVDFLAYFRQDPRFAELLHDYRRAGVVGGFLVLIRVGDPLNPGDKTDEPIPTES